MSRRILLLAFLLVATRPLLAEEKVDLDFQFDLVFHNPTAKDYTNLTFRGHSNFHTIRSRVILNAYINEYIRVNAQLLSDNQSTPYWFSAYAQLTAPQTAALNLNVGIIPTPVGVFGARTYPHKNFVIGTPLMYNHKTNISIYTLQMTNSELLKERGEGYESDFAGPGSGKGIPIMYDACWNSGMNLFGSIGIWDYSVGLLVGSVSYPGIQVQDRNPQLTAQLIANPLMGFRAGLMGVWGPHLLQASASQLPAGKNLNDYKQIMAGFLTEVAYGHFEFNAEAVANAFEHPYLGYLRNKSFYTEARYKFQPGFFASARVESIIFSKIEDETIPGSSLTWDYNIRRLEAAIGYYLARDALLKLDSQFNRYPPEGSSLNDDIYALQLTLLFQ
ncbi:MAG: hypothetical protein L0Y74_07195 [candidate division Zixibacteria bacterium]|nr:hypothetical protein [candidate division Zixibacteria bacterium]